MVRSTLSENFRLSALQGKPEVLTPDGGAGVHSDVFDYEIVQGH